MNKTRVGLYLLNKRYVGVDQSSPESGNPGIGGSEYNFITLPYYFSKYYSHVEFYFYAHITDLLPKKFHAEKVEDLTDAALKAKKDNCDLFIFRPTQDNEGIEFLENLKKIQIKTIAWAHNTPFKLLRKLAFNQYILRYVNVGKEQYDMLRDHPIIYKSAMIYIGFDPKNYIPSEPVNKTKSVVYIGSLIPVKGFHALAKVWKEVLAKVPDAKLEVIGTGKLYVRNSKLGEWGIADESYESIFRPYLSDEKGNKLDSVIFHGLLGKEKIPIMQKAMVGCPNPTGKSENCPASALELQACGTPVVSGAFWGLLDTVANQKTGLLGKTDDEFVENIVFLLKDEGRARTFGQNGIEFVNEKFDYKRISTHWKQLFDEILEGKKAKILPINQNPYYEFKQFSEKMRKLKERYIFFRWIPSYIEIRPYHRRVKELLKRIAKL